MVEFMLCAFPLIFVTLSVFWAGMAMWEYHTLAEAVNETARLASLHGADCASQTCATTVEQIANTLAGRAVGIPTGKLNVTLTSSAQNYTCNPLSSCQTNASAWPSLSGNTAWSSTGSSGTNITISATYQLSGPISMYVPGHGSVEFAGITLGAKSTQPVLY